MSSKSSTPRRNSCSVCREGTAGSNKRCRSAQIVKEMTASLESLGRKRTPAPCGFVWLTISPAQAELEKVWREITPSALEPTLLSCLYAWLLTYFLLECLKASCLEACFLTASPPPEVWTQENISPPRLWFWSSRFRRGTSCHGKRWCPSLHVEVAARHSRASKPPNTSSAVQ